MKHNRALFSTLFLALGCTACALEVPESAPVDTRAQQESTQLDMLSDTREEVVRPIPVSFEPRDLMTATRATPPTLTVDIGHLSPDQVSRVTSALSLVTWPDAQPVRAKVHYTPRDEAQGQSLARFVVAPDTALQQRWYALRLEMTELPEFVVKGLSFQSDERVWLSRFHVGSHPTLRETVLTPLEDGLSVRLELSERVRDVRSSRNSVTFRAAGQVLDCTPQDDEALKSEYGTAVLSFLCPSLEAGKPLEIDVASSLRALSGKQVMAAFEQADVRMTIAPEQLSPGPQEIRLGPAGQVE